jgi:hypothetical protein
MLSVEAVLDKPLGVELVENPVSVVLKGGRKNDDLE